jgi:HK97 family phage major capsid protein
MKTLEQLRSELVAKLASIDAKMAPVGDDGKPRDMTAAEVKELEALNDQAEALLGQIAAMEKALALKARGSKPADFDPATGKAPASPKIRKQEPGSKFGRYARCLYLGRNDHEKAATIAEDRFGDEDVAEMLRASDVNIEKGLTSDDADKGGTFVPPDVSSEIIEPLRAKAAIRRLGPTIVDMPRGTLEYPKLVTGVNGTWVGEATANNAEEPTSGSIKLVWKKLQVKIPMSKELLRFGGPNIEATIRRDTIRGLANTEDQAFIRGLGTDFTPKGLRYWAAAANVFAIAGVSATNVESDFSKLLEKLEGNNVDVDEAAFLMSSRSKTWLAHLRDANGNLIYPELRGTMPRLYEHPVSVTNNIPNNLSTNQSELYYVAVPDVVIGQVTEMEVEITDDVTYTNSAGVLVSAFDRDEVVLKVTNRVDLITRYDQAVAVMTAVTYGA